MTAFDQTGQTVGSQVNVEQATVSATQPVPAELRHLSQERRKLRGILTRIRDLAHDAHYGGTASAKAEALGIIYHMTVTEVGEKQE